MVLDPIGAIQCAGLCALDTLLSPVPLMLRLGQKTLSDPSAIIGKRSVHQCACAHTCVMAAGIMSIGYRTHRGQLIFWPFTFRLADAPFRHLGLDGKINALMFGLPPRRNAFTDPRGS